MPEIVNHISKNVLSYVIIALLGFFGKSVIDIKMSLPVFQKDIEINRSQLNKVFEYEISNQQYKMQTNSRLDRLETTMLNLKFPAYGN